MLRRPAARTAALALAPLFALAALPSTGRAVGIQSPTVYRIINDTDKPLDYVVLGFAPTGAIVAPNPDESDPTKRLSPLTIGAHSPGLDPAQVNVGIIDYTKSGGPLQQALGIDFQGDKLFPASSAAGAGGSAPPDNSLKVGQFFDFTLNLRSLTDQLQFSFIAPPSSSGIRLQILGAPAGPGSGGDPGSGTGGTGLPIPEPLSLAIWASLAGLGLLRAHAFRRSQRPLPTA